MTGGWCPLCRAEVPPDGRYRPFCSERCKLLDLSAWTTERYRIAGDPIPADDRTSDDDT